MEQEPFLAVRSFATGYPSGHVIAPHAHEWHQLLFASSGAMTVSGGHSSWMVPPSKAVFLPGGCAHSVRMWGTVNMRSLAFPPTLQNPALAHTECRVISVTPLLRELILRVIDLAALDIRVPAQARLLDVLLDELAQAPVHPLALPMPADARALAAARLVLAAPSGAAAIEEVARRSGASRRTLERLFRKETGISFGLWVQKARLLDSIRVLAEGNSVTEAALESGYSSLSAFIAAFRRTFGYTPGKLSNPANV